MPECRLILGDCLDLLPTIGHVDAVVTDPPYGMKWNTNSRRFSGGVRGEKRYRQEGRDDWGDIANDERPFDPAPWLEFPKAVLWGSNHYAARLPVGTTLVWIKRNDSHFGTFLSDAEMGWMKGGHGVYCFRKLFPPPSRIKEGGIKGKTAHPTQKPVSLMRWCIDRLKLKPGSTILDPYMGSGSTIVAAIELGFNAVGIESDPTHFATAERRITAHLASTPLFASQP